MRTTRPALPFAVACAAALVLAPGTARAASSADPAARPTVSLVDDIAPGPASSDPQDLTAMNGELFFSAWSPGHGRQLWKSNGTAAGTRMLTDVSGPAGADPLGLAAADGELFFSARDPRHGRELWKSNGTKAGTVMVRDLVPGPAGSDPEDITYAIGQQDPTPADQVLVYFSAWTAGHGRQLWKSDGTAKGTVMLSNVNPRRGGLVPEDITPLDDTLAMFSGDDPAHGREPWVTDGTRAGTTLYEDLNPGPGSSDPAGITAAYFSSGIEFASPLWYFTASDGKHGRELYAAYPDDAPATAFVYSPGPAGSDPGPLDPVAADTGLFAATTARGRELFEAPGPPPSPTAGVGLLGTATVVPGVRPGAGSDPALAPTVQIGTLTLYTPYPFVTRTYFTGEDGRHGRQLWQADEFNMWTAGEGGWLTFDVTGVRLVDDIGGGPGGSDPQGLVSVGGVAATPFTNVLSGGTEVFSASDRAHGRELWTSNGWPTNTAMAADIDPGPASSDPRDITVIGQVAYFTANDGRHGRELWKLTVPPTPQMELYASTLTWTAPTGSQVTVTADLQRVPKQPRPSGRVTFYENGLPIGTGQLKPDGSGGMSASVSLTARRGTHPIVAVYTGDARYTAATSNTLPLTGD
jgi:ELWxxDGT repeat protein